MRYTFRSMRRGMRIACAVVLTTSCGVWGVSAAADAVAAGQSAESVSATLTEIVVTARRRNEILKDVPVAVTAYTADALEKLDIGNVTNTLGVTPGLYFTGNPMSPNRDFRQLVMRGVGANSQLEPSVATFIDGVYAPALDFDTQYLDVDHIEVLKGPQGALFGRNTEGGAVNIVLRKPNEQFRAQASMSYDNFNTAQTSGAISGPVLDNVLFGSVAVNLMQSDYFVTQKGAATVSPNPYFPGRNLIQEFDSAYSKINSAGDQRQASLRASLRYLPTDDLEMTLSGHASRFRGIDQGPGPLSSCHCYIVDGDQAFEQTSDSNGITAALAKKFAAVTLNVALGYESATGTAPYDFDGTAILKNNFANFFRDQRSASLEIRLTSTNDSPLQWLAGLYGFHDRQFNDRFYNFPDLAEPGYGSAYNGLWNLQRTKIERPGVAGFGQVSYDFSPALQLAVGGRYSWERAKDTALTAFEIPDNGILPYLPSTLFGWADFHTPVKTAHSWTNFSPQASLRYKWNPDLMTYLSISRGFKAGSYQVAPVAPTDVVPVNPERTTNYEIGVKGDFADHRLSLDADIFYIKIRDQQLQSVVVSNGLLTSAITNASSSHSKGAELSLVAQPTKRFTVTANAAYTQAVFDNYQILPQPNLIVDRSGEQLPNTPKWTAFLGGAYKVPVRTSILELAANYRYVGSLYVGSGSTSADPILPVSGWNRLDVSASLITGNWTIRLFANNVTDRYIVLSRWAPFFVEPQSKYLHDLVDAPRRWGLGVTYKY